ncbi:MAG: hypothetical protein ACK41E_03670 [Deinococcales bacterium]
MLDQRYRHFDGDKRYRLSGLTSQGKTESETNQLYEFYGKEYRPSEGRHWSTKIEGLKRLVLTDRITTGGLALVYKRYDADFPLFPIRNVWTDRG